MSNREDLTNKAILICNERGFNFLGKEGEGGFKDTFKIIINGEIKALKVYQYDTDIDRMDREIEIMTNCDHPHIARIEYLDIAKLGDQLHYYCVEEYLGGGTLLDRIKHGVIDREIILDLGKIFIDILSYLIDKNLVHRDIKPENIMFKDDRWDLFLTDFGIVRDLNKESLTETHLPWGLGTPGYAPKEQMENNKRIIGWRTDQFAIGITLGIAATQIHPFNHNAKFIEQGKLSKEFVNAINDLNLIVILKMIQLWPAQRFGSINKLSEAWNGQG